MADSLRPPRAPHPLLKGMPEVPELHGRCTDEHFVKLGIRLRQRREFLKEICWLSVRKGYCFQRQSVMSKNFGVPTSTIRNWQRWAVEEGYLVVVRTGRENHLYPDWRALRFIEEVVDQSDNSGEQTEQSCRSPSLDMNLSSPGRRSLETTAGSAPVDTCGHESTASSFEEVAAAYVDDPSGYDEPAASGAEAEAGTEHSPAATVAEVAPEDDDAFWAQLEKVAERIEGPEHELPAPGEAPTPEVPTPAANFTAPPDAGTEAKKPRGWFDPKDLHAHPRFKQLVLKLNAGLNALRILHRAGFGFERNNDVLEALLRYHAEGPGVRHAAKAIHDFIHDAQVLETRCAEYKSHADKAARAMRDPVKVQEHKKKLAEQKRAKKASVEEQKKTCSEIVDKPMPRMIPKPVDTPKPKSDNVCDPLAERIENLRALIHGKVPLPEQMLEVYKVQLQALEGELTMHRARAS